MLVRVGVGVCRVCAYTLTLNQSALFHDCYFRITYTGKNQQAFNNIPLLKHHLFLHAYQPFSWSGFLKKNEIIPSDVIPFLFQSSRQQWLASILQL